MKFALFTHVPWPEGYDPARIFAETLEEVQYGEQGRTPTALREQYIATR